MTGRTAHVEVADWGSVVRVALDRSAVPHLTGLNQTVTEIALRDAEGLLEVVVREHELVLVREREVSGELRLLLQRHVDLNVAVAVVDFLDLLGEREREILLARQLEEGRICVDARQNDLGRDLLAAPKLDTHGLAVLDEEPLDLGLVANLPALGFEGANQRLRERADAANRQLEYVHRVGRGVVERHRSGAARGVRTHVRAVDRHRRKRTLNRAMLVGIGEELADDVHRARIAKALEGLTRFGVFGLGDQLLDRVRRLEPLLVRGLAVYAVRGVRDDGLEAELLHV